MTKLVFLTAVCLHDQHDVTTARLVFSERPQQRTRTRLLRPDRTEI